MGILRRLFGLEEPAPPTPDSVGRELFDAARRRADTLDGELAAMGVFTRHPGVRGSLPYCRELLFFAVAPLDRVLADLPDASSAERIRASLRTALLEELTARDLTDLHAGSIDHLASERFDAFWRVAGAGDPFALGTLASELLGLGDDVDAGMLLSTSYTSGLDTWWTTIQQIVSLI